MSQLFKNKASLFIITLLLFTSAAFADELDPGGMEGGDAGEAAAPISDWIPLMIVLGIALAFYFTRKRKQVQQMFIKSKNVRKGVFFVVESRA